MYNFYLLLIISIIIGSPIIFLKNDLLKTFSITEEMFIVTLGILFTISIIHFIYEKNSLKTLLEKSKKQKYKLITYDFSGQTAVTNTNDWSPKANTEMADWVNGKSIVNGTYWTGTKTVKGWNLSNDTDGNATPSGSTGPNSGYNGSTGFMYTEVSSSRHAYVFVCRTPALNFSTLMSDTSNDLKLKFRVHAYGSQTGDLFINISTNSKTTHSSSTNLASYTSFSGFTGYTSAWKEKEIINNNLTVFIIL